MVINDVPIDLAFRTRKPCPRVHSRRSSVPLDPSDRIGLHVPGPFPNPNSTNAIGDKLECALVRK